MTGRGFPESHWSTEYYAELVLADFVRLRTAPTTLTGVLDGWQHWPLPTVNTTTLAGKTTFQAQSLTFDAWTGLGTEAEPATDGLGTNPQPYILKDELIELLSMVEYRGGALAEALAQRQGIATYFRGALPFSRSTHPKTTLAIGAVMRVAHFLAQHYKGRFNRPRPSQLAPALMPPIPNPGHASFPSAHATEAYMVALALSTIPFVRKMRTTLKEENDKTKDVVRDPMQDIARRIARNREVLGVHYPSDSEAGRRLAAFGFWHLHKCDDFETLMREAHDEWPPKTP